MQWVNCETITLTESRDFQKKLEHLQIPTREQRKCKNVWDMGKYKIAGVGLVKYEVNLYWLNAVKYSGCVIYGGHKDSMSYGQVYKTMFRALVHMGGSLFCPESGS